MKIISVVGARPNFMKIAPFIKAIKAYNKNLDVRNAPSQSSLPLGGVRGGFFSPHRPVPLPHHL